MIGSCKKLKETQTLVRGFEPWVSKKGGDKENVGVFEMVMDAPTIPISAEDNLEDPIDIRVDIIHPEPSAEVAFPVAAIEELTTLRFKVDITEAENASLHARIKTTKEIEKITRNCER
nr:hypothetical protein [Tanacetum cinerariifolium]GEY37442.1 hypothetical protein [Tanacetum cinerariifolium]